MVGDDIGLQASCLTSQPISRPVLEDYETLILSFMYYYILFVFNYVYINISHLSGRQTSVTRLQGNAWFNYWSSPSQKTNFTLLCYISIECWAIYGEFIAY